jgi:GH25 family lysozyme M1 (1,4-beta-N-acetylmuramidase)
MFSQFSMELRKHQERENNMLIGVDLSHYQKTPDFEVMKQGGVRFSVPRCSQGNFITDNAFPSHYRASRDAKLITGTFHYIDPTSTCTGINEAHYVVNILKDWPVDFMAPDFEKGWRIPCNDAECDDHPLHEDVVFGRVLAEDDQQRVVEG